MKKSVKGIIGLGGVLVVLGGGLAALKLTEPKEEAEESSEYSSEAEGAGIALVSDASGGTISKVTVKNRTDELEILMAAPAGDSTAATYTLGGYEDVPLNTAVVGTLANNANGLTSNAIVAENCEDTAKYGFDDPEAEVTVEYDTGTQISFTIGDTAPTGSDVYFMLEGDDTVYTVASSKMANYSKTTYDFMSTTMLEEPAEEDYPIVNSLRIEREDIDYDIYLEYDSKSDEADYTGGTSATHVMREPAFSYLSVDDSTPITNGMFGLTAEEVYRVHAESADIAEAGLDQPFCKAVMSCDNGEEYVLLMSEGFMSEVGTQLHYAMFEGSSVIYTVSAENAQWATIKPIEIASKILFGTYVWDISKMTINCEGLEEINFEISLKDGVEEGADSYSADDVNVTKNGAVYNAERYRQFYAFLVQASAEEFALDEQIPSGNPMASIEIYDSYVDVTQKVEFYDYSALNALIVVDGEARFLCGKSYVETIIENAKRIDTGEDYVLTWK